MDVPDTGLVISGISGRFPNSDNLEEFKHNLTNGIDMLADPDDRRFPPGLWGLPTRAGRLKDISKFDYEFFGYSKDTADYTDHQLRILYEVVYESIVDSGVNPASLRGSKTGVFLGLHCNEFENAVVDMPLCKPTGYYAQFATKVAHYFDFRGQVSTYDAACASAFVALHNAISSLQLGLVDQAVVCSSNIPIHPTNSFIFLQMQMLSPTGYSRFLDSQADGYVKSEACVSVFLQQKDVAMRNYTSILATKCNVDGFKPEGITFPSSHSQEALMRETMNMAKIHTDHVEYIEAHGTGTPAGDPQEAEAISKVYYPKDGDGPTKRSIGPILVGSIKTNMGHSEGASGLCSLAKVILMFENEIIYKNLHFNQANPNIESLIDGRLKMVTENLPLSTKIIPMSCYGFGGANVHGIFRANPKEAINSIENLDSFDNSEQWRLVLMFGRNEDSLKSFFDSILSDEVKNQALTRDFFALVDSLSSGPIDRLMKYRGYSLIDMKSKKEIHRSLVRCDLIPSDNNNNCDNVGLIDRGNHYQNYKEKLCYFVYPGLGSEWKGMASGLKDCTVFWSTIERLDSILQSLDFNLIDLLMDVGNQDKRSSSILNTFIGVTAVQIALTNLLKNNLNIAPTGGIIGHSLGEIACGYADGVFDEREAILLAYNLSNTIESNAQLVSGLMVAINLGLQATQKLMREFATENSQLEASTLYISCDNGPDSVTVSGTKEHVESFLKYVSNIDNNILYKVLDSNFALHNPYVMQDAIKLKLIDSARKILHPGTDYIRDGQRWFTTINLQMEDGRNEEDLERICKMANAEYYANNLCRRVQFHQAIKRIAENSVVIEIGPHGLFEPMIRTMMPSNKINYIKLMKKNDQDANMTFWQGIGSIFQAGLNLTLAGLYPKLEYPVKRQTPSISSLLKWDHSEQVFVPRYPEQFSKSSARTELPVEIIQERDKYLTGHTVEGRILFPATGYLYHMWRVFSFTKNEIYDACFQDSHSHLVPVEFHNVRLHRAVMLGNSVTQLYLNLEASTGKFEIKDGDSIVVDGTVKSPEVNPNGLLYEDVANRIKAKNLELTLNNDDVYKQFRVNGYDYGETFRCIQSSTSDGRFLQVKYDGHMIALTDSILQSIFVAISSYAPTGGLYLPTRFDYVRFNPDIIFNKIRESGVAIEQMSSSLSTLKAREAMKKMMMRDKVEQEPDEDQLKTIEENKKSNEEEKVCIFDTYCELETGIIITDGIEMRGVKASPAPRREPNEPLLESYQFVPDIEEPIQDIELSRNLFREEYSRICANAAYELIRMIDYSKTSKLLKSLVNGYKPMKNEELEVYLNKNLVTRRDKSNETDIVESNASKDDQTKSKELDVHIKEEAATNKPFSLLSIFNSLLCCCEEAQRSKSFDSKITAIKTLQTALNTSFEHGGLLKDDIMLSSLSNERFIRPLMETIIENTCHSTNKLRLLEINIGETLLHNRLKELTSDLAPNICLDYTVAHPDPKLLKLGNDVKTHTLKDVCHESKSSLLSLINNDQTFDAVCYYDSSCYAPSLEIESNGLGPLLTPLTQLIHNHGFLLVMMRDRVSLAERFLMALKHLNMKQYKPQSSSDLLDDHIIDKVGQIKSACEARIRLLLAEAKRCNMTLVAKKMDSTGCSIFMFQNNSKEDRNKLEDINMLHIKHGHYEEWLDKLKEEFKQVDNKDKTEEEKERMKKLEQEVWLCAVATKDNPINGIVGMMQCLKRELGSKRLRCFLDCDTFKTKLESQVTLDDIRKSENFVRAFGKNLFWNCIKSNGECGSFRHFTLSEYFNSDQDINGESHKIEATQAYVNITTRGDLSSFKWYQAPYTYLSPEEKKQLAKVNYSALNFRDIMLATGRLPLDSIPLRLAMSDCLLGLEFSGLDIYRQKRIAGMIFGRGMATHVLCPDNASVKFDIPDDMSLKDAATIPVVYTTVIMALLCRGKMRSGESILIHAGSGGVGQAAIRLALHHNLKIFTTVGNKEKRDFLLEEFEGALMPDHIFNSRDCLFEAELMKATNGRGVDLVLNSLAEDKLQASIRCLAENGRFLEIGKYDLAINSELELLKMDINKSFHGVHLDKLFESETVTPAFEKLIRSVEATLQDGLKKGYVKPIKHTCFSRNEIEQAFRYMATGKHIGKVLIEIEPEEPRKAALKSSLDYFAHNEVIKAIPRFQLDPTKTYIITGGLGGFGMELSKWLVSAGARHLVLTSRTGLRNGYQRATLERLERNQGCKSLVLDATMADCTTREGVEKLFHHAKELSPEKKVGGIFHLAMVLKDSLLENMTSEDFYMVCKPKAEGCILLDKVSRQMEPDMSLFVTFSSVSCGKGNAGQANYGYANSIMERICERRRQDNLHGLAVQWGAIGDVGVAYENLGGNDIVIGGTIPQRMPSCFATLAKLLCTPFAVCSSVVPIDRKSHGAGEKGDLVGAILHVLGIKDKSKVNEQANLGELGLDSLMAVEIRQYIEREYEITLNVQEIRALTIAKIREIGQNGKSQIKHPQADESNSESVLESHIKMENSLGAKFNKDFISSFTPQLALPKQDFVPLNNKPIGKLIKGRPIFLIPPIYGQFDRMELISEKLSRPCLGLNWTRKLGQLKTATEAAMVYVTLLENLDWNNSQQQTTADHDENQRVVDLIGYSFGATIAFEILVLIQDRKRSNLTSLEPGRLILLDGSPTLIELSSQYMAGLDRQNPLTSEGKIEEMLVLYIIHHTKHLKVDYTSVRKRIASIESVMAKLYFTRQTISQILNITEKEKLEDLSHAIEAYCRRYEIILNYKTKKTLTGNITLIRAKQSYLNTDDNSDDYSLSKVVDGEVDLHILEGNHESFINDNVEYICKTVEDIMMEDNNIIK